MRKTVLFWAVGLALASTLIWLAIVLFNSAYLSLHSAKLNTLVALTLWPLCAVGLAYTYRQKPRRGELPLFLTILFSLGLLLAALGFQCFGGFGQLQSWGEIWKVAVTLALGVGVILIALYRCRKLSAPTAIALSIAGLFYSLAALGSLNIYCDHSPPLVMNMTVGAKHTVSGLFGTNYYTYLHDPSSYKIDLAVNRGLYTAVEPNDHICTFRFAGWLNATWQHVSKCD